MLYTFVVTEAQLDRITDYLDAQWQYPGPYDRYIWSVQRSLIDDHITLLVECDEHTATFIHLLS
jgi:hypothetical protein